MLLCDFCCKYSHLSLLSVNVWRRLSASFLTPFCHPPCLSNSLFSILYSSSLTFFLSSTHSCSFFCFLPSTFFTKTETADVSKRFFSLLLLSLLLTPFLTPSPNLLSLPWNVFHWNLPFLAVFHRSLSSTLHVSSSAVYRRWCSKSVSSADLSISTYHRITARHTCDSSGHPATNAGLHPRPSDNGSSLRGEPKTFPSFIRWLWVPSDQITRTCIKSHAPVHSASVSVTSLLLSCSGVHATKHMPPWHLTLDLCVVLFYQTFP